MAENYPDLMEGNGLPDETEIDPGGLTPEMAAEFTDGRGDE